MSFSQQLKFCDLAKLMEALANTKSLKKRDAYVADYFKNLHKYREDYSEKNPNKDSSLLPVLRLFLAQDEKERSYGLAEKTLRSLYIRTLNLHKDSSDALKITRCSEEELTNKIFEVMKSRTTVSTLTIAEVDSALTYLSLNQKNVDQENELRRVILKSNALDQKWFSKMILKKMHLNIGVGKILRFYHPKAERMIQKYSHLSKVVELIESGQAESALIEVTRVFEPIRSMLSQKFTSNSNKEILQNELFMETKMDGERFQIHMKNNEFKYYSRNGHDYSEWFNALLTPLIKFTPVVHSIILDGEMLVYDKNEKRYNTKGETPIDVKYIKDRNSQFQPCYCAFDVLLYNDQDMMTQSFEKRHQLLAQLFNDREGAFVKTNPIKIRDLDHVVELFNNAIDNGEEGIILKNAQSVYQPGERTGGWYKFKADYFDGKLVKDFDCIVIGGFYENFYTKNFIQRYMLGAIEKQKDDSCHIYAIGEVVHGITVQERKKISDKLKQDLITHSGESEVSYGNGKIFFGTNKPHFWIPPTKSIVLECRVSELEPSTRFKGDLTFRFPRIVHIRRDKLWDESCTMEEFLDMCKGDTGRVQKTVMRQVHKDDLTSPTRKRKSVTSVASIINKARHATEYDDVKVIDEVLDGKEFCVLTKKDERRSLKEIILEHSGTITEHPRKGKTFAIIATEITNLIKPYIKDKVYNIIKEDWMTKNFEKGKHLNETPKIRPIDLHFGTEAMNLELKETYDEYGDSYTEPFESVDELKALLATMKPPEEKVDLTDLYDELKEFGMESHNFMDNVSAIFPSESDDFLLDSAKLYFKYRGGQVEERSFSTKSGMIRIFLPENKEGIDVNYKWILDSNDAGKLLEVNEYL